MRGLSRAGYACRCSTQDPHSQWRVIQRHQRCSAFDGYRVRWSPYSAIVCLACHMTWRTKAQYVNTLPDYKES